jgi:large subunit ribosomal protein L20
MSRVKRGKIHQKKRRKLLKLTKGYQGQAKNIGRRANEAALKAGARAYNDRKIKKREARKLWNVKINAGVRENGMTYSTFINALKKKEIELDRKVLATLAEHEPEAFKKLVEHVK